MSNNLARRVREHANSQKGCRRLRLAIEEFGIQAFEVVPLCYSLGSSTEDLADIEAEMIRSMRCVENGFNTAERGFRVGPYGAAFSAAIRAAHARPEVRAKIIRAANDPENRMLRGASIKAALANVAVRSKMSASAKRSQNSDEVKAARAARHADPEFRARRLAIEQTDEVRANRARALAKLHADPEIQAYRIEQIRIANVNPERNRKIAEARRALIWITNGTEDRGWKKTIPIPEGWRAGRRSRPYRL